MPSPLLRPRTNILTPPKNFLLVPPPATGPLRERQQHNYSACPGAPARFRNRGDDGGVRLVAEFQVNGGRRLGVVPKEIIIGISHHGSKTESGCPLPSSEAKKFRTRAGLAGGRAARIGASFNCWQRAHIPTGVSPGVGRVRNSPAAKLLAQGARPRRWHGWPGSPAGR